MIEKNTFKGGVHPPDRREHTLTSPIKDFGLPSKVIIPLLQYGSHEAAALVKEQDKVKTGQTIAASDKFLAVDICASISGRVVKISQQPHPTAQKSQSIVIESDGTDETGYEKIERDYRDIDAGKIREIIKQAGVVGMGGAGFPTHAKLTIPENESVDSLIINLSECEPYLTVDYRLALERTEDFIRAARMILKVLNADKVYLGIDRKRQDLIDKVSDIINDDKRYNIVALSHKYPQGEEKRLIKALLKRTVAKGKLPYSAGVVVFNIQTILAAYEAVCFNRPLYEKVITLSGGGVKERGNLKVRIGTTIKEIIEKSGGFTADKVCVVAGGPMMGQAQADLEAPVTRSTSGILVLTQEELGSFEERECIRCARCLEACPAFLMPLEYNKLVKAKKWAELEKFDIKECMECGACAFVCPSKIPLVERIKRGKRVLASLQRKK